MIAVVRNPHPHVRMVCYISALASCLGVSFDCAFELLRGEKVPPYAPGQNVDVRMSADEVVARLAVLGFKETSLQYTRLRRPAIVFAYWPGGYEVLHAVVWDPETKRRVDPAGHDTLREYRGTPVRVLARAA